MEIQSFVVPFLTSIVMVVFFAVLSKSIGKKPKEDELGQVILKMPKLFKGLGIALLVIGIALIIGPLFDSLDLGGMIFVLISGLIFLAGGGVVYSMAGRHQVAYDNEVIEVTSYFGKIEQIRWKDIEQMKHNRFSNTIILISVTGDTIKMTEYLKGINEFLSQVKRQINKA